MNKYLLLLSILLFSSTLQLKAQESIGYSDSTDFQYLLDYQLPDWGYSNFSISSANVNLSGDNQDLRSEEGQSEDFFYQLEKRNSSNIGFNLGVTPRFELYRENEKRIINFDSFLSLGSSGEKRTTEGESQTYNSSSVFEQENLNNQKRFGNQISFTLHEYSDVKEDLFLIAGFFSNIQYSRGDFENKIESGINSNSTVQNRTIRLSPSLGVGFGRLRNVTPMIRTLRVNERYKALGNPSFNSNEIFDTADLFTKVQGYQRTKDRFLKSFWGDVNSGVNGKLDNLNAYDLFYLNDVFSENLGQRLEGYSISVTGNYSYLNNLRKQEQEPENFPIQERDFSIIRTASIDLNADWYKNLNLYHQINVSFLNETVFPLERDIREKWTNASMLNFGWLWSFADRFQFNSSLNNLFFTHEVKDSPEDDFIRFTSELSGQLSYFIENKMSISAGISIQHRKFDGNFGDLAQEQDQFFWGLNAGIKYYFNRNLY